MGMKNSAAGVCHSFSKKNYKQTSSKFSTFDNDANYLI